MNECAASRHGTQYAYRCGCRCVEAVRRMRERWRRAKPPAARPRPILVPDRFSAHVDEIAVEKAMAGDRVPLTVRERAIVVRRLTAAGLSARRIGERLGVTARSVQRYRSGETARWVA